MRKAFTLFFRRYWFRLAILFAVFLPAALTQTTRPVVSFQSWENLSDKLYARIASFSRPPESKPSQVVIVEVDKSTIEKYGWPISRAYYTELFSKLKERGHPYVMSMLGLQALHKSSTFQQDAFKKMDEDLAEEIRNYGRLIGGNMQELEAAELTSWQEDELLPRVALSNQQTPPEELPYLPMHFLDDDMFLDGQLAFGFGVREGESPFAYCSQMYITDKEHKGMFVIPSALAWFTAYASGRGFSTTTGANWPRSGEEAPVRPDNKMQFAYRHCVSLPQMITADFFSSRSIQKLSMASVIDGSSGVDMSGKSVILAMEDTEAIRGPGNPYTTKNVDDSGKVKTTVHSESIKRYELAARLVDDMLTGRVIRRESLENRQIFSELPLMAAAVLTALTFLGLTGTLFVSSAVIFLGSLAWATFQIRQGIYDIPIQLMAYCAGVMMLMVSLDVYLRFYGIGREIRFTSRLRRELAQCNSIFQIEEVAQKVCNAEFLKCRVVFEGFDRGLYAAANDAKAALKYLDRSEKDHEFDADAAKSNTQIRKIRRDAGIKNVLVQEKGYKVRLQINSEKAFLGEAAIKVNFMAHEEQFIGRLLESLRLELSQHWNRVKLLVDQKLLDYRFLMEQTRSDILSRFLTQTLVSRFSNKMTMEENLNLVLTPRPTRAALMQADIRGYSRISAKLAPKDMVELLRNYYKNVVDAAQTVAQVKLIGDCIFLFIEESPDPTETSPVDLCLELASILIHETNRQNGEREAHQQEPMYFGIGIHFGEVVVGNLSSDICIDYTAIGPNVNMVARLEEMTKHKEIADRIGRNGTIISPEAMRNLKKHDLPRAQTLDLASIGVSVRSFSEINTVYGLTSDNIMNVDSPFFDRLSQTG
jgi:class 3 adenylate cyclase/CHASE2 domain-containing sensor protein